MINLYLHAGSDNHGCEAIVRSTTRILDQECRLYSLNASKDFEYRINHVCEIESDIDMPFQRKNMKWMLSAMQTKLTGKIDLAIEFRRENLLSNIKKGDIFLSIGGDNYCYPGTDILAAINRNIKKKGGKLVLWGCSIEPFLLEQKEIADDIQSFDLITARESISYEALKTINPNTVQVADPAFTLEIKSLPLPTGWIDGNMVGINASPLIMKSGKDSNIIYSAYRMLIQNILEKTDCGIALIPHVVCEGNDDLDILRKLYDEFKESNRVILITDHNCMELKGHISRCRFFVGARTHATIAAYSTCVPTLVLGYSVKSRGIAKDLFGTDRNYVLPVQKLERPEELFEHFWWIMNHEMEIKAHLKKIMPEYILKAYTGKDAIEKIV